MALAELEFPQRRRPALHYVGPMVHADRHDVHATPEVEGRAEAVVARCREAGTRLVYAAASSMAKGDAAFLRKVAGAFARRPDWHLVVGLGGQTAPEALGALPPNATALEWAPQLRLLDAAEAAVVPGGINTIHECLHFRVPMAVYSDGLSDQDGCAARLAYHGLGVRGRKSDSETEIERTLERVLTDGGVRQSVERFHALYERSRRSGAVARLVEAHLPS
jgi:UDP:flavonoid glycosyltransferase YjiC (YdhE family)